MINKPSHGAGGAGVKEPNYSGEATYLNGEKPALGDIIEDDDAILRMVVSFDCYTGDPVINSGIAEEKRLWFAPWITFKTGKYYHYALNAQKCTLISRLQKGGCYGFSN